jgi:hypothetical protein
MTRSRELAELATAYDSGGGFGFRNRIINGDCRIDQRNNGASVSSGINTNVYTLDRWAIFSAGAAVTVQRVAGPAPFQFAARITGATGNTGLVFLQRIESFNSADLAGSISTLAANVFGSSAGTVTWDITYANTSDNFNGGITSVASGTFNYTTSNAAYNAQITLPSAATTGLQVRLSFNALGAGQTLTITGVQLEAGSVATPFERRPFGTELALCQRYYQNGQYVGQSQLGNGSIGIGWPLMVEMRASPTGRYGATTSYGSDLTHRDSAGGASTITGFTGFGPNAKRIEAFRNSSNLWQLYFFYDVSAEL